MLREVILRLEAMGAERAASREKVRAVVAIVMETLCECSQGE